MKARYWIAGTAIGAAGAYWLSRRAPAHPRAHLLDLQPEAQLPETESGSIQFIGTATTLIRYQGMTILTDPNFLRRGDEAHIGFGMHATRLTDPAIEFDHLPRIDFVLLSHLHETHFDKLVERRLARHTPILTTASAARTLSKRGFTNTYPLRTWDRVNVRKGHVSLRVTAMPGTHGRLPVAAALPDVMGSMLEFRNERDDSRYRIYITGDTLFFRGLREIARRYPEIDLMLLHLGGTRWFGLQASMNAAQGLKAMNTIQPGVTIPIHYHDYEMFQEPIDEFTRAVEYAGRWETVRQLSRGEAYSFVPRGVLTEARPLV
jgi:L-ascorbate metabolism protein UlaG (beta-lactamase superfamily)